jgi:uncharacterized protein YukE
MGEQLSVHPESLIRAGAQFSIESRRLADAVNRLQSSLHALGDVCGDDDQGRAFAKDFNPATVKVTLAMQNMAKGLSAIGRGLEVMGLNYEGGDAASQVLKTK